MLQHIGLGTYQWIMLRSQADKPAIYFFLDTGAHYTFDSNLVNRGAIFSDNRYIDQGRNPQLYTKDCLEKALEKNQQVNGKIDAYKVSFPFLIIFVGYQQQVNNGWETFVAKTNWHHVKTL